MIRNIVLAVSTIAACVVLLVGYSMIVGAPTASSTTPTQGVDLPEHDTSAEPLRVGRDAIEVPPGGKMGLRRYDERTGVATDMLQFTDWRPVPGSSNEVHVTGPELAVRMAGGMIVTVSADEGQLTVDRVESTQANPKQGWLSGNVKIVVDRNTQRERPPAAERPEDLITVRMAELEFDLELGELKTDAHVEVAANEFEVAGTGLHLIWNQADNRVDKLHIDQGDRFVLYGTGGLVDAATRPETALTRDPTVPDAQPTRQSPRSPVTTDDATAYACTLSGGVTAEQITGGTVVGGLEARTLRVLFDVGGGAKRALTPHPTTTQTTSQPATRPTRDRLAVRWSGPLDLQPTTPPTDNSNRRHIVARGDPVVLTRGEAVVRCGQIEYHDETQRAWLNPRPAEKVLFSLGPKLSAEARAVYLEQTSRRIKLIGDVHLQSRRGGDPDGPASSIRCAQWAILHLADDVTTTQPVDGPLPEANQLESARFVGDVQVDIAPQQLAAHQLDVRFRPAEEDASLDALLDTATAWGHVHLRSADGDVRCMQLDLTFDRTTADELYPRAMRARGDVVIARGRSQPLLRTVRYMLNRAGVMSRLPKPAMVHGDEIEAELAPPTTSEAVDAAFVIRQLEVTGAASLRDPRNHVAAKADRIVAQFEHENELLSTTVLGSPTAPARVHATPYTVQGVRIDLDRHAESLRVDGASRLMLKTRRSLQGDRRDRQTRIVVDSTESLHIDGELNEVRFVGDVRARSGAEQLEAERLKLLLEDVPVVQTARDRVPPARRLWRVLRALGQGRAPHETGLVQISTASQRESLRKELAWVVADDALVTSETRAPGEDEPILHASVSAPQLDVDVEHRQIFTTGRTQLLMIDRRGLEEEDVDAATTALGVPSALISRGASQTAMQCTGRMIYTLGDPGPQRRDTVVLEDDVVLVHRAGRNMVNLSSMLPDPNTPTPAAETEENRNAMMQANRLECWFEADPRNPAVSRGGALTATAMQLSSLIASGAVYLRDEEDDQVREVHAAWLEFSREFGLVNVRGVDDTDARVYFSNVDTQQFDFHAGERFTINLKDGTILTGSVTGQMTRP